MKNWQEELLSELGFPLDEQEIFDRVVVAARDLGFDHCSYGLRCPLPLLNPQFFVFLNYPSAWVQRYSSADYVLVDPTVLHGQRSQEPLLWSDAVFEHTPQLWDEARSLGLRVGWAQSCLEFNGAFGMLTLARSHDAISAQELNAKGVRMRWLASIAHLAMSRALTTKIHNNARAIELTTREIEVLKWTAAGKTSDEVGHILAIAVNTVNFHVRNAQTKLNVNNKTAAAVKAAMLGWLR